ncbi:MAG: hypothetical protein DMG12_11325 [Acidobacteria bacterium]|nr:MAG: hypothetical protein DMG12_11325 [Acidobacteriota bacterium]
MKIRKGTAFVAIVLALTLSAVAFGAGQRRNQQQQQQRGQEAGQQPQSIGPQATSKDELDGFVALQNEQNPATKVTMADAFVSKFPNSDFVGYAHTLKMLALIQTGKPKEAALAGEQALDATVKFGERMFAKAEADAKLSDKDRDNERKKNKNVTFLDKNSPQFEAFRTDMDQRILGMYQQIIASYQQANDAAKVMEWGEKAYGYKPDDLNTLMVLSNVMAERPSSNEEEKAKQMKRAEEIAKQAVSEYATFVNSPAAAKLSAEQKSGLNSSLHYTLGLVFLHQKKFGDSEKEFLTAINLKANDPITYYRLGLAYLQDMKNDAALDAFARSVFLKGVSEASARDILKQLYVQKNKSEVGLEDFIKNAGQKIGQ